MFGSRIINKYENGPFHNWKGPTRSYLLSTSAVVEDLDVGTGITPQASHRLDFVFENFDIVLGYLLPSNGEVIVTTSLEPANHLEPIRAVAIPAAELQLSHAQWKK